MSGWDGFKSSAAALVLLGLALAPRAARADLPVQVKLYGFLNAEVEWVRALGGATPYTPRARVSDGNSRLGITGSYDLGPNTKATFQLEGFLNNFEQGGVDDLGHPATLESRNSYVSIEDKRFGSLIVGYYDNAYRSLVGTGSNSGGNLGLTTDGLDLWNNTSAAVSGGFNSLFGRGEARYKNSIHYLSPDLFGVRIAGSYGMDETLANGGRQDHFSLAALYVLDTGGLGVLKVGIGWDHQANTGVDTDLLLQGLGMQTTGVDDVSTSFYKAIASYFFPTGTYLGVGYEWSVYGYANFIYPSTTIQNPSLQEGNMSQGGAMISVAQAIGDKLTAMASAGKLGNLSNAIVSTGNQYASSQFSLGAKYAFSEMFMTYIYFTRIDNEAAQNITLGSPIFSNQVGTNAAYLAPGNKPMALGSGMICRF